MEVHLYALCWNDRDILPFFLRHYDNFVSQYFIFDDHSTDGSVELLRSHGNVEIRPFTRSDPHSFVLSEMVLSNQCWKRSRGSADWVIVTDIDEHLFHPDLTACLLRYKALGITIVPTLGYQMISEKFPQPDELLSQTRFLGAPWDLYSKLSLFDPMAIAEIAYDVGRHRANPTGRVVAPSRDEWLLLHYKYLGFERTHLRHQQQRSGLRTKDLDNGWGYQYSQSEEDFAATWREFADNTRDVRTDAAISEYPIPPGSRWWDRLRLPATSKLNRPGNTGKRVAQAGSVRGCPSESRAIIGDCATAVSPASVWVPDYFCQSAWVEHAPFAFWLCEALRPRRFVELGTHYGFSYFAFCQAIDRLRLGTVAYAVDTWEGDEHTGFYDESVYDSVDLRNDAKYSAFSSLIRAAFDDAQQYFADGSVDLLHIDGRHLYDDLVHDFETWRPKLTKDAVVLFHDTNVRERGFGVWKFFAEATAHHPSFEFVHGHGLGVLIPGDCVAPPLAPLFQASFETANQIRATYAALGAALTVRSEVAGLRAALATTADKGSEVAQEAADLRTPLGERDALIEAANTRASTTDARLAEALAESEAQRLQLKEVSGERAALAAALEDARAELASSRAAELEAERQVAESTAAAEAILAEAQTLRQGITRAQQEAADLWTALGERDALVEAANTRASTTDARLAEALAESEAQRLQLREVSGERAALAAALDDARAELASSRAAELEAGCQIAESTAVAEAILAEAQTLRQGITRAQQEAADLWTALGERDALIEAGNTRASTTDARLAEALAESEAQRLQLREVSGECAALAAALDDARAELASSRAAELEAGCQIAESTAVAEAILAEAQALRQEIIQAQQEAADLQAALGERDAAARAADVRASASEAHVTTIVAARDQMVAALALARAEAERHRQWSEAEIALLRHELAVDREVGRTTLGSLRSVPGILLEPRQSRRTGLKRTRWRESAITIADRARDLKRWELAARSYRRALARNPLNPPIWIQYGHVLKESGRLDEAETAYRQAVAYWPHDAECNLQLGHILKTRGKTDEARSGYLKAVVLGAPLTDVVAELKHLDWPDAALRALHSLVEPGASRLGDFSAPAAALSINIHPHLVDGALGCDTEAVPPAHPAALLREPGLPVPIPIPQEEFGGPITLVETSRRRSSLKFRVVYVSGESDTPGHTYRVVRPMAAAARAGAETSFMRPDEISGHLVEIETADAIVFWRTPWDEQIACGIEAARRGGAKIIFDVDDLMIDPAFARSEIIDGIRSNNYDEAVVQGHYSRVRAVMGNADLCLAPTDELAAHMRNAAKPTIVLPNGFDHNTLAVSRHAARQRSLLPEDGLVRIGYAAGTRTHQRDFAQCAEAVAGVLRRHPQCRLVAFRSEQYGPTLNFEEFACFAGLDSQIEWRLLVSLEELPYEIARFDINLAPLEVGNPFCEAKSELKFFEAALTGVPTIASPTGPYRRAIRHSETGFLADTQREWHEALTRLLDADLRRRIAANARRDVLWKFGPEAVTETMEILIDLLKGGDTAARAFEFHARRGQALPAVAPHLPEYDVIFGEDHLGIAEITIAVPLYNYENYIHEALNSITAQTISDLDLIIADDRSTDASLAVALDWAKAHAARFNRISILQNRVNSGLGATRNLLFDHAETAYVLPLDADNRLLPDCAAVCFKTLKHSSASFAYPLIRKFGDSEGLLGVADYDPVWLSNGNYIDAMALVAKAAWAHVGGYDHIRTGWEDFDLWCKFAERGLRGKRVPGELLAEYRVHPDSMIQVACSCAPRVQEMTEHLQRRHPWLTLVLPIPERPLPTPAHVAVAADSPHDRDRLRFLLPILRCPETGARLTLEGDALTSEDGSRSWPIVSGRPVLFPGMPTPAINPDIHLSNPLPDQATAIIRSAPGMVLHLSAGGSAQRFDHVVEVEAAIFRNTDIIGDVHRLPFADSTFSAVIALNAFEHYRDPQKAIREIYRVLCPGGRVLIHTAFLQPLHESPLHFYNCTRHGLEAWFERFETETLKVSDNFHAGYSISWLASECEGALREKLGAAAANALLAAPVEHLVSLWRDEKKRDGDALWSHLRSLPQEAQEKMSAGFEYVGRRPFHES